MFPRTLLVTALIIATINPLLAQSPRRVPGAQPLPGAEAPRSQELRQQQVRPPKTPQARESRPANMDKRAILRLQTFLSLDASQTNQLRALLQTRRQELEAVAVPDKTAFQNLRLQPNPNPAELGNATIAMQKAQQELQMIQERFVTGFKGMLTPGQLELYDAMVNAANNLAPFRALGLIGGPGR